MTVETLGMQVSVHPVPKSERQRMPVSKPDRRGARLSISTKEPARSKPVLGRSRRKCPRHASPSESAANALV